LSCSCSYRDAGRRRVRKGAGAARARRGRRARPTSEYRRQEAVRRTRAPRFPSPASSTAFQNLARQHATQFGLPTPSPPSSSRGTTPTPGGTRHPEEAGRPHLLRTGTPSVVVSTTADVETDVDGDGAVDADSAVDKAALQSQPRGFFADQFEVPRARLHTSPGH
jgi:hypothetical protein